MSKARVYRENSSFECELDCGSCSGNRSGCYSDNFGGTMEEEKGQFTGAKNRSHVIKFDLLYHIFKLEF